MRIRVLGGGWYGSHLACWLIELGHDVELHEIAEHLFAGASGANPGRLHQGFHYPRSWQTREASRAHAAVFMQKYGHLTRAVPLNIYAVAEADSTVDFGAYLEAVSGLPHIVAHDPSDFGLMNVEGAVLTAERHIIIDYARSQFTAKLDGRVRFNREREEVDDPRWDLTLDCTFCANDGEAIDRYEPCVMGLLRGRADRAVTIMDGPFPSIYPWEPAADISSLTSASLTPLSKTCRSYEEAVAVLDAERQHLFGRAVQMFHQMKHFWPEIPSRYTLFGLRTGIRAMPKSGADARLVDVVQVGQHALRVRPGKIDAIFRAQHLVEERLKCW